MIKAIDVHRIPEFGFSFGFELISNNSENNGCNSSSAPVIGKVFSPRLNQHGGSSSLCRLKVGDELLEVNGINVSSMDISQIDKLLRCSGNRALLKVRERRKKNHNKDDDTLPNSKQSDFLNTSTNLGLSSMSVNNAPLSFSPSSSSGEYDNVRMPALCQNEVATTTDMNTKELVDSRLRRIDPGLDRPSNAPPSKSLDLPSAQRLARRLFNLEGFRPVDVARQLAKRNEFSQLVVEQYLLLYDFHGETLDRALRRFLSQFSMLTMSEDRERVLHFFSARYNDCNPTVFSGSVDSCHVLTCALLLLNTDLHSAKNPRNHKKMSFHEFCENLRSLNDGADFSKDLLKSLYNSIKAEPLVTAPNEDESEEISVAAAGCGSMNTLTTMAPDLDGGGGMEFKRGYIMRKCCFEVDGRKTPFLRRNWSMFFASLRDLSLWLYKNVEDSEAAAGLTSSTSKERMPPPSLLIRVHHSLASEAPDYKKRRYVFRFQTADYAQYLFQAASELDVYQWIEALNLAAALFSSPPLPAPVGSSSTTIKFQRPLLPSVKSRASPSQQYEWYISQTESIRYQLQSAKASENKTNKIINTERINYLEYELNRYTIYIDRLCRYISEVSENQNSTLDSRRIFRKGNRYSYMMAIQSTKENVL